VRYELENHDKGIDKEQSGELAPDAAGSPQHEHIQHGSHQPVPGTDGTVRKDDHQPEIGYSGRRVLLESESVADQGQYHQRAPRRNGQPLGKPPAQDPRQE